MNKDDMKVGMAVDALDSSDIYCPATVLSLHENGVRIRYDGWGKKYDTLIPYNWVEPSFSKVQRTRGWAKLNDTLPHWPCIVFLRVPKDRSKMGSQNLEEESKVFVKPFGVLAHRQLYPYSYGFWLDTTKVSPISKEFDSRKSNGFFSKPEGIRNSFKESIDAMDKIVDNEGLLDIFFRFVKGSFVDWEESCVSDQMGSGEEKQNLTEQNAIAQNPKTSLSIPKVTDSEGTSSLCTSPYKTELAEPTTKFAIGDVVSVASRTWPGINKPGGVGRIRRVTVCDDSSPPTFLYNVSYVLGGKEDNILAEYVSRYEQAESLCGENGSPKPSKRQRRAPSEFSSSPETVESFKPRISKVSRKNNRKESDQNNTTKKVTRCKKKSQLRDVDSSLRSHFLWVACDSCGKWRRIPSGIIVSKSEPWFCRMNSDEARARSCADPQEDILEEFEVDVSPQIELKSEQAPPAKKRKAIVPSKKRVTKFHTASPGENNCSEISCDYLDHSRYLLNPDQKFGSVYRGILRTVCEDSKIECPETNNGKEISIFSPVSMKCSQLSSRLDFDCIGTQFTSKLLNSFGMGNDLISLSEVRFMLGCRHVLPPQFVHDLLQHGLSLVGEAHGKDEIEQQQQQRCNMTSMLDIFMSYDDCLSNTFGPAFSPMWSPSYEVVDNILAELMQCSFLRYQPLSSFFPPFGSRDRAKSNDDEDRRSLVPLACSKLPYLLNLLRFAARYVRNSKQFSAQAEVSIKTPVPCPNDLDLDSNEMGTYTYLRDRCMSLCHTVTSASSDTPSSIDRSPGHCGWLHVGAIHRTLSQLQQAQHRQPKLGSATPQSINKDRRVIGGKDNTPRYIATPGGNKRSLRELSPNSQSMLLNKTPNKLANKKREFDGNKKIVPLSVRYSPQEMLELYVLKPLGLLHVARHIQNEIRRKIMRKKKDDLNPNPKPEYKWLRLIVKMNFNNAARFGAMEDRGSISDAVSSSSQSGVGLHAVRAIHCHIIEMDDLLEELLVLYVMLT